MLAKALKSDSNQLVIFLALLTFARIMWLSVSGHNLYGDEAQYWLWSKNLDWGYYSKPPVIAWAIRLSTILFGEAEWAIRIFSPLTHTVIALITYKIAIELFDKKTAIWSALTYITLPAVFVSSSLISTDPFLLLFWSLSFYTYIKAFKTDHLKWWVLLGVASGLGMLTKYSMGLLLASILLHLHFSGKLVVVLKSHKIWIGGLIAFLIWLPNLVWNYNNSMASLNHTYDLAKGRADAQFSLKNFGIFFISQFAVFGPVLFSTLIYFLIKFKKSEFKKYSLLLIFSLTFFLVICVLSFLSRAHANWAAPTYIAATIMVVHYLLSKNKLNLLKTSFMLHLILGVLLLFYGAAVQNFDICLSKKNDMFKRVRGFSEIGEQLDTYRLIYPSVFWATDDRMNLSSFAYYTKPHAFDLKKWNPSMQIKDHFDLTTSMAEAVGKNVVVISNYYTASSLIKYGKSTEEIGCLYYSPYEGLERKFNLILIRGFKGYYG